MVARKSFSSQWLLYTAYDKCEIKTNKHKTKVGPTTFNHLSEKSSNYSAMKISAAINY